MRVIYTFNKDREDEINIPFRQITAYSGYLQDSQGEKFFKIYTPGNVYELPASEKENFKKKFLEFLYSNSTDERLQQKEELKKAAVKNDKDTNPIDILFGEEQKKHDLHIHIPEINTTVKLYKNEKGEYVSELGKTIVGNKSDARCRAFIRGAWRYYGFVILPN